MVTTVAAFAPEMAPKIADVPTVVMPRLPQTEPNSALDEIDQPLRNAAAAHQFAGIDEERHREQSKGVHRTEEILLQRHERHIHEENQRDGHAGQQHHEDREAEQQQNDRHDCQREGHSMGSWLPPFSRRERSRAHKSIHHHSQPQKLQGIA